MTNILKRLGYGGSAVIDGVQVLITSGGFEESLAVSYLEPLSIPPSGVSRSRIKHADGVAAYSGSIGFDVTSQAMAMFSLTKLLDRYYTFDVGIDDGENFFKMVDCKLTSLTLSGAPGGLITASVSVVARTKQTAVAIDNDYILDDSNIPLGYWWSGNTEVRDWSFTMNQSVTPMYLNVDTTIPKYLKVGLISYSIQATTYTDIATGAINIETSTFTLTGDTTSNGYSYGGVTELGMFAHAFETAAVAASGSGGTIIT